MNATVVFDHADLIRIADKMKREMEIESELREAVAEIAKKDSRIAKLRNICSQKCNGSRYGLVSGIEIVNALGIDESEWNEWFGGNENVL